MTTVKLINGKLHYSKEVLEKIIRGCCYSGFHIEGFNNKEEVNLFIKEFPKYVKLINTKATYLDTKSYTTVPCVRFYIGTLNKRTGEFNETGERRIKTLIRTLENKYLAK